MLYIAHDINETRIKMMWKYVCIHVPIMNNNEPMIELDFSLLFNFNRIAIFRSYMTSSIICRVNT